MHTDTRNQVIALSGLFQATQLVKQLAWEGHAELDALEQSLRSVFIRDAQDASEVYPSGQGFGLRVLRGQLGGDPQSRDVEVTRYSASLLQLERKLARRGDMRNKIGERITAAAGLLSEHPVTHAAVVAQLAAGYQDTISTLSPRVMVNGEHSYLVNEEVAAQIRALLLAGIRAAILWRQCGGSRWRLLFGRSSLMHATDKIIHSQLQ
ncbi:MAG: high frequency lysogenization protein HflD [Gammaproteobacteria bacterium]|nr:high frequency lysogenization protein HflD [Gammaproteobacteria bacterium]